MAVDPRLLRAIQSQAPRNLRSLLLATALVESGGRLDAVGDQGMSYGPYQEHSRGRGSGIPPAQRMDPVASTQRAVREFQTFFKRGARGPSLAYRAQRPANREDYIRKISAALPQARQLLAQGGGPATAARAGAPAASGSTFQVTDPGSGGQPFNTRGFMNLIQRQTERALQGQMPEPTYMLALANLVKEARSGTPPQFAYQAGAAPGGGPSAPGAAAQAYRGPLGKTPARNIEFASPGNYNWANQLAKRFGLQLASTFRDPATNRRVGGSRTSRHMTKGAAADFSGPPEKMRQLAEWAIRSGMAAEVFYDPLGVYWDNGRLHKGRIGGHSDHVHISWGRPA